MVAVSLALVIGGVALQAAAPARDIPTEASATISGRVTERDSALPLPRIVVTLASPDGAISFHALTDADGRYQFASLRGGKYVLWAQPDEHRSTYLAQRFGESVAPGLVIGPVRPNVELKPGEARSGMDIALTRALAVEGRVLDPGDEPIARVEVSVSRALRINGAATRSKLRCPANRQIRGGRTMSGTRRLIPVLVLTVAGTAVSMERHTRAMTPTMQACDEGAPTPEQVARRKQAVQLARSVNTAEARVSSTAHAYKPLSALDTVKVPEGLSTTLLVGESGYMFKVQDQGACGVTLFSDQAGLIYTARPLQ